MSRPMVGEAQRALLRELPGRIPVERIDRIWLFRPRDVAGRESGLVVLSLLPPPERPESLRQVITWHYQAEQPVRGALRREDTVTEEGWAPAERIPRLIDGVLARLGDETEHPIGEEIAGLEARWAALLASLDAGSVDSEGG